MRTGFRYASRALLGARPAQEDACRFAPGVASTSTVPLGRSVAKSDGTLLAVLADGMGGHVGGAEASNAACDAFVADYQSAADKGRGGLSHALASANNAISLILDRNPHMKGMGCTLIGAAFGEDGVSWVSVGDSLLMLFREGRLYQINEDHSMGPVFDTMAEKGEMSFHDAENHPRRHFLRAALVGEGIEMIDLSPAPVALRDGDVVLLASDGIEVLSHGEIADCLAYKAGSEPEDMVAALLASITARAAPHQDNVTVMVVQPVRAA